MSAGRLKVTHVLLSLDVGGLERGVVNHVMAGRELGQDVTLVCLERPGTLAPRAQSLGARVVCMDKPPGLRPALIGRLARALREIAPDVLHTHQVGTLFYGGAAGRRARVPLIVHTEHGRENYGGRMRTRLLARWAGRYADRFYCLTGDMADGVKQHRIVPPDKVRVILNGIDTARFREPSDAAATRRALGVPAEALLVGTVGRLTEIKRQDVLIRAFARLAKAEPLAHLVLVGDGPLLNDLNALAHEQGVGDRVHFAGYQPDSAPYLHAMDVFCLTSRSEGMPQAVLEASVVGLPVIASRVGGLPEVIDHGRTGLLFEAGDDAALADALRTVVADREAGRRMGLAARDSVVARFDIRRMAQEYHRDFLELLAGKGPAARVPLVPSA